MSEDLRGKFLTHIASGRLSSECTTGLCPDANDDARRRDFGEPDELVARLVELLDELLLLLDRDLDGDRLEVLPDGDGDLLPDRLLVFFFVLCVSVDLRSFVSVGVELYPVSLF